MNSVSIRGLEHGRLTAWDAVLAVCWLSGLALGCACGALWSGFVPDRLLLCLSRNTKANNFFLLYFGLTVALALWNLGVGDFILPLVFAGGAVNAFTLCLLLSAPDCLGWLDLLASYGQHFLLLPARFRLWQWILQDNSLTFKPLWLIVLYCICVFLFFVFMSVF